MHKRVAAIVAAGIVLLRATSLTAQDELRSIWAYLQNLPAGADHDVARSR